MTKNPMERKFTIPDGFDIQNLTAQCAQAGIKLASDGGPPPNGDFNLSGAELTVNLYDDGRLQDINAAMQTVLSFVAPVGIEYVRANLILKLIGNTEDFIYAHYDASHQQSLTLIYTLALIQARPNQAAYVGQAISWVNHVLAYHFSIKDSLRSAADLPTLQAIAWDYAQQAAADPNVLIQAALGIID